MNTILSVANISKIFENEYSQVKVLDNLSFEFVRGKSYGIVGPSGCGKSTLIAISAGIQEPSSGKVLLGGKDIYALGHKDKQKLLYEHIGIVLQSPYLIPELTVLENVIFKEFIKKKIDNSMYARGIELLTRLNLQDKANSLPQTLSGGQAQRVSFLRALYNEPSFLFADEPIAHLDCINQKLVLALIQEAQQKWGMVR